VKSESKQNDFGKLWGNKKVVGGLEINVFSLGIWSQCNNLKGAKGNKSLEDSNPRTIPS
jgi:hypothetical protein